MSPMLAPRRGAALRYDRGQGLLMLLDAARLPAETAWTTCTDAQQLAGLLAVDDIFDGRWRAFAAGYGLALTARAWAGRPSDARRGALILDAERLSQARPDPALRAFLRQALAHADHTLMAGGDVEAALAAFVDSAVQRGDRVAARCGQIAAELVDDGDRLLAHGAAGPALAELLRATQGQKQLVLTLVEAPGLRSLALSADSAPATVVAGEVGPFDVLLIAAERIALDGSVAVLDGAAELAQRAKQDGAPCYVLGYDGPDSDASDAAALDSAATVPPELISAIVTHRGTYRPAMIARHLGDSDPPLDVIPLG
ncbi:MAG TPA: hypothetical protein VFS21_23485 [Roseiflexaceae bacterium]|nr:hypothetical protein [Roseiflexaceae bacterium]